MTSDTPNTHMVGQECGEEGCILRPSHFGWHDNGYRDGWKPITSDIPRDTAPNTRAGRVLIEHLRTEHPAWCSFDFKAGTLAIEVEARHTALTAAIPFIRHRATCALQAVRDNHPDDSACTCGLREVLGRSLTVSDLDQFVDAARDTMLARMEHGAAKFGALSWRAGDYYNEDVLERLRRAVDHLEAALNNTTDPAEWAKRAADVANQAFMAADPARVEAIPPRPVVRGVFDPANGAW
jgi:hypothetical protein